MTLTIEIAQNDWNRISKAFGAAYNLGHNASEVEVTNIIEQFMGNTTQSQERNEHNKNFTPPPFETSGL